MLDEQLALAVERLRGELVELRTEIRGRYSSPARPVMADAIKRKTARLAETWLVEIRQPLEGAPGISRERLADLSVRFQRLLIHSERASQRARYETEIAAILRGFTQEVVIPLKQAVRQGQPAAKAAAPAIAGTFSPTAFVGHSFATEDAAVVACILRTLGAIGVGVLTGERPQANQISAKIMRRIERQHVFVGIFTRRDKLPGDKGWTTSPWIIEEKTYALAKGKPLILLREEDVDSIGGIQGDYQHVTFTRTELMELALALIAFFNVSTTDLQ